jgi:hypothetical protein
MGRFKLPPEVLEYFRKEGAKGGKLGGPVGGKKCLESMSTQQRRERAKIAAKASVAARAKRKRNSP